MFESAEAGGAEEKSVLCELEPFLGSEIDRNDHRGFLSVCRALGITDKFALNSDLEAVEVFSRVSRVYAGYGIDSGWDFEKMRLDVAERERLESVDKENDKMEIELCRSQEQMGAAYVKKKRLEELKKEKLRLEGKVREIEEKLKLKEVSKEIVALAKSLGASTVERKGEIAAEAGQECVEVFHAIFLPFVDVSVEAVNFLYSQISFISGDSGGNNGGVVNGGGGKELGGIGGIYRGVSNGGDDNGLCDMRDGGISEENVREKSRDLLDRAKTGGEAKKELAIKYLKYVRCIKDLGTKVERSCDRKERIDYEISRILLENVVAGKTFSVADLCATLGRSRPEVIERVFFLASKRVLGFSRKEDTVRFCD